MSAQRRIETEVEVPGTPEEVWEAIATGPGITAWFMPAEVDGRVGGSVVHRQEGFPTSEGRITGYEPPRRFAYEEDPPLGDEERPIATEFLVEARSGGTCVVRVVMSGFGEGDAWDKAIESFTTGWEQALRSLRLYLTHFRGEPVASINAGDVVTGAKDEVWAEFAGALGVPAGARAGDRIATSGRETPELAGTVEEGDEAMFTLLLDRPARGLGFVGVGGPGDEVLTIVRASLFGAEAGEIAAREQEAWKAWFAAR
jgi:uncharacterized protein YndB with AHSA1/START domain